jgi:hypothetical protein
MTPQEARLQLDASTLRPSDADAEARALAARDSEMRSWLEARTATDEKLSAMLCESPIPAGLNERIVAAMEQEEMKTVTSPAPLASDLRREIVSKPLFLRAGPWLALAAAVAIVMTSVRLLETPTPPEVKPSWQIEALAFVNQIDSGDMPLDRFSGDLEALKAGLTDAKSPAPKSLPQSIEKLASLGCKTITLAGRPASIICFRITPGHEAHLVVIDNAGLSEVPPQSKPQFTEHAGWNVAGWSDGPQSFLLVTRAETSVLKKIFGLAMTLAEWARTVV